MPYSNSHTQNVVVHAGDIDRTPIAKVHLSLLVSSPADGVDVFTVDLDGRRIGHLTRVKRGKGYRWSGNTLDDRIFDEAYERQYILRALVQHEGATA